MIGPALLLSDPAHSLNIGPVKGVTRIGRDRRSLTKTLRHECSRVPDRSGHSLKITLHAPELTRRAACTDGAAAPFRRRRRWRRRLPLKKTETARRRTLEAVRRLKESQRSETGTPPPPGVTSRKAMLCKERGRHSGRPARSASVLPASCHVSRSSQARMRCASQPCRRC